MSQDALEQFLKETVAIDLEADGDGHIYAIGAIAGDRTLVRRGSFDLQHALRELEALAAPAQRLLGHNLLEHDLPILRGLAPHLKLLQKPVVDTLYLSPLAFPENPYHRLVKDYKLVRDSLNDPLADARLARGLFADQWRSFSELLQRDPDLVTIYRHCLDGSGNGGGLVAPFDAIGVATVRAAQVVEMLTRLLSGRVCAHTLPEVLARYLPDRRMALAYCVAWLRVAGGNSVLPPWVRHRFPEVAPILRRLRDSPCGRANCGYCRATHDPVGLLQRYFGFPAFRAQPLASDGGSLQQVIVRTAMADQPLFAILPTGGGKSLCFQLPALARYQRRGLLTIVISPLQALMKDQVDNLRRRTGSPNAAALYGLLTAPERGEVLDAIRLGDVAILYVSPEQLRNRSFTEAVSQREIGCWVFDEAHCLSKWGHDFRPDYLYAARFIKEFAHRQRCMVPPVQCFTATAKEDVRREIVDFFARELGQTLMVFEGGVARDNLRFEVQTVNRAEKFARIDAVLHEHLQPAGEGCALVYCATRKRAEAAAEHLQKQGWEAAAFHAGLAAPAKLHVQENFINGLTQVICATNAFGMGIDKEDVRLVIHADIPGSLENYLQEAGRAGRDRAAAECVLLYDEQDIETQFKLGSLSELSRRDIAQILRGLRSAGRNRDGEVVLTTGELLRADRVEVSFDVSDRNADTKVVTAVAWLERAGFLERNQNRTQVFQGRPVVNNLDEARRKIARLDLSERQQQRWLGIIEALMNADLDEGFSADELAQLAPFSRDQSPDSGDREQETPAQRVLRTLQQMAEAGLIRKSMLLSAYVRYKVRGSSELMLEQVCALERALLDLLQEQAPDADEGEWQSLSLRQLNQRLRDDGQDSNPEILRNLLKSLTRDGQGLAARRGSLDVRYQGRDELGIKLQRDWCSLRATAERRQAVATVALGCILARVPPETAASAELLVEFSAEEVLDALRGDLALAGQLKDPLAAVDRALMFLHEQRVVTLQKGLAVFRQAMTIRVHPEHKGRRYGAGDFEPLSHHYRERIFQVHVMNEYARRGLEKITQAVNLVAAYFSQDKKAFVELYFADRKEILERATGQESYRRIVEALANPIQTAIVAADENDNMLVLAGPGSGKTRVVVHRCAYLLSVKRVQPERILMLCFNRNAALELRRRLFELVGPDARRVTVQTYHGLAVRLTGHSLVGRADGAAAVGFDFDGLLREAVALLQGKLAVLGVEPDEMRDRLLAGYRHILVDEYQDIDRDQYQLVSALAGRTLSDRDRRLGILAVGDDDQNIYQFRGANVAFIRQFQQDYQARVHHLVANYRSSAHIIAAANSLISLNRDRMKIGQRIRVNREREDLDPGGRWAGLDPLARGRVRCLRVDDAPHQAAALVAELGRMRELDPTLQWSQCAVLAREWSTLGPIRAWCEDQGVPVTVAVARDQQPPPLRVRENRRFLDQLRNCRDDLSRAGELLSRLERMSIDNLDSPWWRQLRQLLEAWREETGDAALPVHQALEYLYEALLEQHRQGNRGDGVWLSTAHSAKGMEFDHVFIPDGGWGGSHGSRDLEEQRRLYYVAMTRARENLCLFERRDTGAGLSGTLAGDYLLRWTAPPVAFAGELMDRRYTRWGLQDLDLGFAGRQIGSARIHRALARLGTGAALEPRRQGDKVLLCAGREPVAALSRKACREWLHRLDCIDSIAVVALIQRTELDGEATFRSGCRVPEWEVPMVDVCYRAGDGRGSLLSDAEHLAG